MRISHLLAPVSAGGLERVVHSLAIGQRNRGHEVNVAAILDAEGEAATFFEPLRRERIEVQKLIVPPRAYLLERRLVRDFIDTVKPEIVHSHGYRTDVIDGGAIRRLGVATVSTAHGFTGGGWRNLLYERLQIRALRRFDAVIAVSKPLGNLLLTRGVSAERLHVIPNGFMPIAQTVDREAARTFLRLPPNAFVVGWVGRMVPEKGLDVMISAMSNLKDVNVLMCAVGSGPEREKQESRADRHGLSEQIRWAGLVPEAARFFTAFDAYVISSRTEGLPISLFEAMASATPIVTTRVGGIPDVVSAGEAIVVEPNSPVELANAIRAVQANPAAAVQRARAARNRLLSEFAPERWLSRHEDIYERAIKRRRPGSPAVPAT